MFQYRDLPPVISSKLLSVIVSKYCAYFCLHNRKSVGPHGMHQEANNDLEKVKVKESCNRPGVAPEGSRRIRLPDFDDIRHVKVMRLSASRTGRLYPQEIFLVFIFIRD